MQTILSITYPQSFFTTSMQVLRFGRKTEEYNGLYSLCYSKPGQYESDYCSNSNTLPLGISAHYNFLGKDLADMCLKRN